MYNKLQHLEIPKISSVDIGQSYSATFELVHEPVTDCLYICTKLYQAGNLTPLLDPETGLPMTLEKYKRMLKK